MTETKEDRPNKYLEAIQGYYEDAAVDVAVFTSAGFDAAWHRGRVESAREIYKLCVGVAAEECLWQESQEVEKPKIAIVGSRTFNDWERMADVIRGLGEFTLVSGGAIGADTIAHSICKLSARPIPVIIHKPDWDKHGRRAGFIRNQKIVDDAQRLIAFWDGVSRGTKSTIDMARKKGIPVEVLEFTNED